MEITKYRCENCGKEVEDFYGTEGWIEIASNSHSDNINFTITHGRIEEGHGGTSFWVAQKPLHFCSKLCLMTWLKKREEENGSEASES